MGALRPRAHQIPHEVAEPRAVLRHGIHCSRRELLHEFRVLAHDVVHARHGRFKHGVGHVQHNGAAAQLEQQLQFGRHLGLGLVLVVQLRENLVVVVNVLVDLLAPTVQLQVKGVKLVVQIFNSGNDGHQHFSLEFHAVAPLALLQMRLVFALHFRQ